jgi:predicted O-methyltransferase YrrM
MTKKIHILSNKKSHINSIETSTKYYNNFFKSFNGGNIFYDIQSWLKEYNSKIFFYGIINKKIKYNISVSKQNIDENYHKFKDISGTYDNVNKISENTRINKFINEKLPESRFNYFFSNYYSKFDLNLEIHNILIINFVSNPLFFSIDNIKNKNVTYITNIEDLKKINKKFNLIIIKKIKKTNEVIDRLKDTLITFSICLDLLKNNGIISIKLNLVYEPSILDTILLISSYSSLFVCCDYFTRNINIRGPIYYIFSEFWKIDKLKNEINQVLKIFNFKNSYSFLKIEYVSNPNFIEEIKKPSKFILNRYLKLYKIDKNKELSSDDFNLIKNYLFQNVIKYNIEINPNSLPYLTRMLSSKLFYLPNGNEIKLHSNINMNEGNYLFNLVVKNQMSNILEIGFAYGISAIFITKGLENNKLKKVGDKHQLTSIDPFQNTQWHNLGIYNLKRVGTKKYHKLYEYKSLHALPYLLKEKKKKYDLIFIDGWHTFDYALVDLFYSCFLIKQGGYLILDDALHPGVAKLIKYIDTNYMGFLKKITNGPRTFGVYIKEGDDKRDWDYHKDF